MPLRVIVLRTIFKTKLVVYLINLLCVIGIWSFMTYGQPKEADLLFPGVSAVYNVIVNNLSTLVHFSLITWYRVIVGLLIGSLIGFFTGLIISASKLAEAILEPIVEVIRPIPPIALTPFFILWFGLGDFGQFLLISLGCFMVIVVNTVVSIRSVSIVYIFAAQSLGANTFNLYRTVYIPAILPSLLTGMRVGAATGFALTVASEYLGAQGGLGYLIRNARQMLDTSTILVAAIILGIECLLSDLFLRKTFARITAWLPND